MKSLIWFVLGMLAGAAQASMLWRNVRDVSAWTPLWGFLRLGLVSAVLVASAVNGQILYGAAGWAIGFAVPAVWLMFREQDRTMEHANGNRNQANQHD